MCGVLARRRGFRLLSGLLYLLVALMLVEATCQIAHRVDRGSWRLARWPGEQIHGAFRRHPHLVGVPRAGFARTIDGITLSHNSRGFRGPEIHSLEAPPGTVRIATLGGSTTYGSLVSDDETWPRLLERELGAAYQVINLGVPGFSTAENVIQTAFWLPDLAPDVALYLVGWNDIRNSHVVGLEPDYADFHAPYLHTALGLFNLRIGNGSAMLFYLKRLVDSVLVPEPQAPARFEMKRERFDNPIDPRVLSLFRRNLESIIALCRVQGIRPILIPQVLNDAVLVGRRPTPWSPTLRERDLPAVQARFNEVLIETGGDAGVRVVTSVLVEPFTAEDFLDQGHFSPRGNRRIARLVARALRSDAVD